MDKQISKDDFLGHYRKRQDVGEAPSPHETDAEFAVELGEPDEVEELPPAEKRDRMELKVDDWFRHLSYRSGAFNDFYPFLISDDQDVLRVKASLTLRHQLYVFFLLSSNLTYFGQHQAKLTKNFELLSAEAIKTFLPGSAEVHVFGAGHQGRYTGNLWKKISRLAVDLKEIPLVKAADFSAQDSGDKGLDIVAWVPVDDPMPNLPLLFGQCACTFDEWVQKQSSSAADAWRTTMTLSNPPSNVAFIPFCLRRPDGSWHKRQDIHQTILIDRLRFISLLRGKYSTLKEQFSDEAILKMLDQEAAIA
ncbi:MAG TPA: hypothetical protein VJS64_09815 [Pyrinomonadaceae bacterium]|nr:hypothetical protein [Pyrinomonadaceae bacterium]